MQLEFEYSVADYKEANRAHMAARMYRRWLLFWIILVIAAFFVPTLARSYEQSSAGTTQPAATNPPLDWLLPAIPWAFLFPVIFLFFRTQSATPKKRFIDVTRRMKPWVGRIGWSFGSIATLIFVALVVRFLHRNESSGPADQMDVISVLLPLLPWAGVAVFIFFVFRGAIKRAWKLQPALQRPKIFSYSPTEVSISDQLMTLTYRWPAIVRCIEAPNIFMLYISEVSFHMIPKRAFPSTDAIDGFRRLVQEWADSRSTGFPVIMAAQEKQDLPKDPLGPA